MEMVNGLAAVVAAVDHHAIAFSKLFLLCDQRSHMQEMSRQRTIQWSIETRYRRYRHDQDMRRCLGGDVSEGYAVRVFIDDVSGDLAPNNALKERA